MSRAVCNHPKILYSIATKRVDGVHVAHVEAWCDKCEQPFVFRGVEAGFDIETPRCNARGTELRLPIEPAPTGVSACPDCGVRLFGAPVGDAPPLLRAVAVQQIVCGPEHVVHYADGVALRVVGGTVTLV